jgi:hypothetical protein
VLHRSRSAGGRSSPRGGSAGTSSRQKREHRDGRQRSRHGWEE